MPDIPAEKPTHQKRSRRKRRRTSDTPHAKSKQPAADNPSDASAQRTQRNTGKLRRPSKSPSAKTSPWATLGLETQLVEQLDELGFEQPTDIQEALIPIALKGGDCLGQARTGTGKTAAFALPILNRIRPGEGLQAILLAPTRELAAQVDEHVRMLRGSKPIKTVVILGGRRMGDQIRTLRTNPEIAIGTPGRVLDLMRRRELKINHVDVAVLDEVDRMLDIGFRDDIRRILRAIEDEHQTIFVSATIDEEIQKLARSFMHEPTEVNVSHDMLTVDSIEHGFVSVHREDKMATLLGLLKHEAPTLAIVFTNRKRKARNIAEHLRDEGVACKEIHGDLMQHRRERALNSFRKQTVRVLVATDLASRGLDVMDISHIVNFDIPEDPAAYVHRIGRTARMGKTGYAVTFVTPEEGRFLTEIEKLINKELPKFDPPWLVKRLPTQEEIAAEAAASDPEQEDESAVTNRYQEARVRDPQLEALGLRPVRRTLGSRFRTSRRRR